MKMLGKSDRYERLINVSKLGTLCRKLHHRLKWIEDIVDPSKHLRYAQMHAN